MITPATMMTRPLTVTSLIAHAARVHGGTEIVSVETDGSIERSSWGEVAANARRLSDALDRLGIAPGARVGTLAWNNRRHLELYFAAPGGGRVVHTINPRLTPEHLCYILDQAQDEILFFDRTFLALVAAIRARDNPLRHCVLMGPRDAEAEATIDGLLSYDELIRTGRADVAWPGLDENSPAALCYTSGTTGRPKGVLYTHRSTVLHTLAGNQPDSIGIAARDTVLPVVPMFHVNAWGAPYIAALAGAKLVLPGPKLDGESLVRLIDGEQVTVSLGVPTIWLGLLGALEATGSKAASMTRTVVGGSALPPSMARIFRERYGIDLIHAWGMTETSPLGTLNQLLQKHLALPEDRRSALRESQGRPPWGVELRIVDEAGAVLPNDGVSQGELQVRGHWIVDHYYGEPEPALTDDGWFPTGDLATLDEDGYMTIRDRAKDVIKSGGEWISTVELENIAIAHPAIHHAAAIAARHPKWDERPVLVAIPAAGASPSEDEILAFYRDKVARWQTPDRVIFVDSLPLGATGKVMKNILRERYADILMEKVEP